MAAKISSLRNVMIGKVRYKKRVTFSFDDYSAGPNILPWRAHFENIKLLDKFIKENCVGKVHGTGVDRMFSNKHDALFAYIRFA